MARTDNETHITTPLLERLIDRAPNLSDEPARARVKNLRELKELIRDDLENLLNTRRTNPLPPDSPELGTSLLAYGVPDFTAFNIKNPADQNRMGRALEEAIRTFEPRLHNVTVKLETLREGERILRFHIDARLKATPVPEPISFDTLLQLHNGEYKVRVA